MGKSLPNGRLARPDQVNRVSVCRCASPRGKVKPYGEYYSYCFAASRCAR